VSYGIANDMIACRDRIEYFTYGKHKYFGQDSKNFVNRPLQTSNPNLNALAWGMIATWEVGTIAGLILAAIARVPFLDSPKITARQLTPYMAIGATLIMLVAHIKSRSAQAFLQAAIRRGPTSEHSIIPSEPGKDPIHIVRHYPDLSDKYFGVPKESQAAWEACHVRNSIGYQGIVVGSLVLSVAIIAGRAGLIKL